MTSRPGPGNLDSLQSRGSGGAPRTQARPPSVAAALPQPDCIDPALDDDRPSAHNGTADTATARPPPRGRPPLFFTTTPSSGYELPMHASPYQPAAALPAPPRPGSVHLGDAPQQRRILPGGTGVKDSPALQAPEALPPPPPVHFPGGKAADVFPWTGSSSEDTLSEALVKGGVSNKPQIMNETNTARPSLWSNLKNKSGLTTLSTLFVAVLEKRQQSGRLHAPHTFKPPPRLTLRDSTREQWLHDLANPTIGLRRLSRTIPHGLTGKVLLEQCLNKRIPLPRALWLAKCVGINELRAHKRKGQAGTLTWVRGWTSSVEQFLDAVIASIGQGDWKPRITYSLQLATHLYKEHLLDDDHFLDWILNSLDACPNERLFIWLLVVSVSHYWIDIVSCRRRGKRLAEALLNHLDKLYRIDDQIPSSAVLQYLETTLTKLLLTRPACLLLPTTWARHGVLLDAFSARTQHPQIIQAVRRLQGRANRLLQSKRNFTPASQTPASRVYHILDSVDYSTTVRIDDISSQCMEAISDAPSLVSIVLQWACSVYRGGSCRVYLATRLLRRWSHLGADVYEGVLSYLCSMTWTETGEPCTIFKVVAELVRSKTFAAGRYLQWLIATGSLGNEPNISSPTAWPLRLITEIPLSGLSDQVRTLRCTLLRGTAYSAELEEQALDYAKHAMRQKIPVMFGLSEPSANLPEIDVHQLNSTVKLELGIWLRGQVARYAEVNEHVPTKDPSIEETAAVALISACDFHTIRSYLERFDDLAILADVVNITTSSLDPNVLACAADTLIFHMKAFRAIGALDTLFNRIAMRYAAIRTIRFPERQLLLSLNNLASIIPGDGQLLQLLSYDLSRLDQKNSIAACSPASDNMGEAMQNTASHSDDEIECILSSGTSMDHQMMARVLRKIICNLEEHVAVNYQHFDNYPIWLHRLRSFDEPAFETTVNEWLISCLMSHRVDTLRIVLPCLVASACMGLSSFLETLRACVAKLKTGPPEGAFEVALEGLRSLLPSEDLVRVCSPQDAYRFQLEQHKLCQKVDGRILQYIGDVAELASCTPSAKIHGQLSNLLSSKPVLLILKEKIISDPGCLQKLRSGRSNSEAVMSYFKPPLDALLDCLGHLRLSEKSLELQILAIFRVANELSLPFCQAAIEQIFALDMALTGESFDALSAALLNAIKAAVEEDKSAGLKLIATLDPILTDKIRQYAEREIIDASAFLTNQATLPIQEPGQVSAALVQKYLTILDLTSGKRTDTSDQLVMLAALIDRLRGVAQVLEGCADTETRADQASTLLVSHTCAWLNALLRITVAHSSTLLRDAVQQHQAALMAAVKSLLMHPTLDLHPGITEHIFDVAVVLSDWVSDDVRNQFARLDNSRWTDDPRCLFISGTVAHADGWLALTKPVNPPPPPNPQAPPSSQAQASTPNQGHHMPGSEPATPQQRYLAQQQQRQQQAVQAQQAQQLRTYSQYSQHAAQLNKGLPAQLQRTSSPHQSAPSSLQQMQHMQQMQGRNMQPSPVHSLPRSTLGLASSSTSSSPSSGGPGSSKLQSRLEKNVCQYPFVQPRWEVLADSSGNANMNANETAISLSLFGARRA